MGTVAATEFKARCLELMDRVAERRETLVITKRGRPVAKLVPADAPRKKSILGCLRGSARIVGDVVSSPLSDAEWDALARERDAQWRGWHGRATHKSRARRGPARG